MWSKGYTPPYSDTAIFMSGHLTSGRKLRKIAAKDVVITDINFVSCALNVTPDQQLCLLHSVPSLLIFTPNDRLSDRQDAS